MGFSRAFKPGSMAALAELVCCNVPYSRAANSAEIAHFRFFLKQFCPEDQDCKQILMQALAARRPKPMLSNALIILRDELAEEDRLPFMDELIKLRCSLSGASPKLCGYTVFAGKFLGIDERNLNTLFQIASASIVPKRQ